jgi:hypothetical protein
MTGNFTFKLGWLSGRGVVTFKDVPSIWEQKILSQLEKIMPKLDDLEVQVTAVTDAVGSAIVLINGIAARIEAAGVDPVKLAELTANLKTDATNLAEAVVAGTDAE